MTIFSKLPSHFFLPIIQWDSNILAGTAIFHKGGVRDCNFQNPSEIPAACIMLYGSGYCLTRTGVSVVNFISCSIRVVLPGFSENVPENS